MSSTRQDRRVARMWEKEIVPAARRLAERGVAFFPMGPTDDESWYADPPTGPDFFTREPEDLASELAALWREQDLPELVALAESLAVLADGFDIRDQQPEEISPFVYVMY